MLLPLLLAWAWVQPQLCSPQELVEVCTALSSLLRLLGLVSTCSRSVPCRLCRSSRL